MPSPERVERREDEVKEGAEAELGRSLYLRPVRAVPV